MRDQCPFCRADGKPVDKYLDKKGEDAYYELLDKTRKARQELSLVISLGERLETLQKDSGVPLNVKEMIFV